MIFKFNVKLLLCVVIFFITMYNIIKFGFCDIGTDIKISVSVVNSKQITFLDLVYSGFLKNLVQ